MAIPEDEEAPVGTVRSGPYVFRLQLYPDPDLSPANLGEAFDYYSAVPGWGWRAIAYHAQGRWAAARVGFGGANAEADFALAEPEGETGSYFPCGRAVELVGGGVAFEGGIPLPPQHLPGLGDEVAVWVDIMEEGASFAAELRFRLAENDSWDGLEPAAVMVVARSERGRQARVWSPAEEPAQRRPGPVRYLEPPREGLPTARSDRVEQIIRLAGEEARRLRREEPGSEDLLLAILREEESAAARALRRVGVELTEARAAVQFLHTGQLGQLPVPRAGLLPSAEKALQLAADEARRRGSDRLEPEHLLLGLLRQRGVAVEALAWLGIEPEDIRSLL